MELVEANLQEALDEARDYAESCLGPGKVADYIPELGKADPKAIGATIMRPGGMVYHTGDTETRFTIQSISKVIILIFALKKYGFAEVFKKVGMEPTGDPFNSLMKLEIEGEKPFNPFINAGAIAVIGLISMENTFEDLLRFSRILCGDDGIKLNEAVYESERVSGDRNRSMAYLLLSKGYLPNSDADACLGLYFRMCSLEVTTRSLAHMGLVLSCGGIDPGTGKRIVEGWIVQIVKTLMVTCGMYDGSGEFAVRVGMPSKSGVGGAVVSIAERGFGIGTYGPELDQKGNSIGGVRLLEYLSHLLHLHLFPDADN